MNTHIGSTGLQAKANIGGYSFEFNKLCGYGKYAPINEGGTTESIENYEELANLLRQNLGKGGQVYRTARLMGLLDRKNQIKGNIPDKDYSAYSLEKYKFFLQAQFNISNQCCNVMKKAPTKSYHKKMITAQMASESRLRTQAWLKNGCNAFDAKTPISNPMSMWVENDVLHYIRRYEIPIASVYGKVVTEDESSGQLNFDDICNLGLFELDNCLLRTTGCNRTGCVFCGYGCHLEKKSRFALIDEVSNPALRDFCMRGGAFDTDGLWKPDNRGLGYFFVLKWINLAGGFNMFIPEYERYLAEYGNERVYEELEKAKEIGNGNQSK